MEVFSANSLLIAALDQRDWTNGSRGVGFWFFWEAADALAMMMGARTSTQGLAVTGLENVACLSPTNHVNRSPPIRLAHMHIYILLDTSTYLLYVLGMQSKTSPAVATSLRSYLFSHFCCS